MMIPWCLGKIFCTSILVVSGLVCHAQKIDNREIWHIAERNSKHIAHTLDSTFFFPLGNMHGQITDTFICNVKLHFDTYWNLLIVENGTGRKDPFKIFIYQKEIVLTHMVLNGDPRECTGFCPSLFPQGLKENVANLAKNNPYFKNNYNKK